MSDAMKREFNARTLIPARNWYSVNCCCLERASRERYKNVINKASTRISKEMDLQKFLHRQRFMVTSLLGLLKGRQSIYVDYFS